MAAVSILACLVIPAAVLVSVVGVGGLSNAACWSREGGGIIGPVPASGSGLYILQSQMLYNPADAGISGFASDLGVLLHRIMITLE